MERVLGVLAGGDLPLPQLAAWARSATRIYAADGAADRLLAAGVRPHVVVGDLDSLLATEADLEGVEVVRSTDQENSDADKLLALLAERGHEAATIVGIEGDRLDHVLAAVGSASVAPIEVSLGLRTGWARVLHWGISEFDLPEGTTVSLLPVGACEGVTLTGVAWPLERTDLALGGRFVSNRAVGGPLRVEIGAGTALLIAGTGPEPHW